MSLNIEWLIIAAVFLLYLDVIMICALIIEKLDSAEQGAQYSREKDHIIDALAGRDAAFKSIGQASSYYDLKQSVQLDRYNRGIIEQHLNTDRNVQKQIRRLRSVFKTTRAEAAVYLGLLGTDQAREALEQAIMKEQKYPVKLYIANALTDIARPESIPVLVSSLIGTQRWYRSRVNMLIAEFGEGFHTFLPQIISSSQIEIMELIIDFAAVYFSETLQNYLLNLIEENEPIGLDDYQPDLVHRAADHLAMFYPGVLAQPRYLESEDTGLKNTAIMALANYSAQDRISRLASYLQSADSARSAIYAISRVIEKDPEQINAVVRIFTAEKDPEIRARLATVLSGRIEYFIMKLTTRNRKPAADIIKQILLLGRASEVIDFLNKNRDTDLENELIAILREVVPASPRLEQEFSGYLNERLIRKCGLTGRQEADEEKQEKQDPKLVRSLYVILAAVVLFFPALYAARHFALLFTLPWLDQIKIFVIDFNYYLVFYSIAINIVYIGLLLLSFFEEKRQSQRWRIKNVSLLFKNRMLPSISIIAPAFNEEKTIIESANSLLNLKYPDYELIIVNDGSRDRTLEMLIRNFDLIRVDFVFEYKLKTRPIRGIYMNRSLPNLIVVDKNNGGKADSLNAGINISSKDYFCGIDADSLLEDDALLKLASLTLDEGTETPALGGNILPINGCTVETGHIEKVQIPENTWARLQTIEYLRAFMAGRLGWAALNSLLIISGAFGLFRKDRVIGIGGYLTSSERYAQDTVGEDMELVVRIRRLMTELGKDYRICYAFNSNCWTEVPEDAGSLKRQRYRWHRGLIEILSFHRGMLFNPRYGRTGMLALPYFFIFEVIGPLLEFMGYAMVIAALLLGLLNADLALLLFIATVLLGVLVSISSLFIAEKDVKYFRLKDILILIGYSVLENFGPRQLFSFWRVAGYLKMLGKQSGWGKAERKGFAAPGAAAIAAVGSAAAGGAEAGSTDAGNTAADAAVKG